MLIKTGRGILNFFKIALFPSFCKSCGEPLLGLSEFVLCNNCMKQITPYNNKCSCSICSKEISDPGICGYCTLWEPFYSFHISYSSYEGVLRKMVLLYKYCGMEMLKNRFVEYGLHLLELMPHSSEIDFITTVPQDKGRNYIYNHNELVAKKIAVKTGINYSGKLISKVRSTPPQASLNLKGRMVNLKNAFALNRDFKKDLQGSRVLIVDDVFTTGETLNNCSKPLVQCGAEVFCLTFGRSV